MQHKSVKNIQDLIQNGHNWFVPSLSVDCVVFGFHENELKVLLLKHRHRNAWSLPGGFILKEESAHEAADRILRERTGLEEIFLQQFHSFSDIDRYDKDFHFADLKKDNIDVKEDNWLLGRFVTIGYYALVDFLQVTPTADTLTEKCKWWKTNALPTMILDHRKIFDTALLALRAQLNYLPIGINLLPEKFTMPELQKLYETILAKNLDRRNFQRKIEGFGIVKKLTERRKGVAHRAPYLYTFDSKKYYKALKEGLSGGW